MQGCPKIVTGAARRKRADQHALVKSRPPRGGPDWETLPPDVDPGPTTPVTGPLMLVKNNVRTSVPVIAVNDHMCGPRIMVAAMGVPANVAAAAANDCRRSIDCRKSQNAGSQRCADKHFAERRHDLYSLVSQTGHGRSTAQKPIVFRRRAWNFAGRVHCPRRRCRLVGDPSPKTYARANCRSCRAGGNRHTSTPPAK